MMPGSLHPQPGSGQEGAARFDLLPGFSRSHRSLQLSMALWPFAKLAYLANPLPSLFKERLFVHLLRADPGYYRLLRHAGFLLGAGHPAGDMQAPPHTLQQLSALLRYPGPARAPLEQACMLLENLTAPLPAAPAPESAEEAAVFQACAAICLDYCDSARADAALRLALQAHDYAQVLRLLAYIQADTCLALGQEEPEPEPDLQILLQREPGLPDLLGACRWQRSPGLDRFDGQSHGRAGADTGTVPARARPSGEQERIRVLAIEDNPDFAQLFGHMLEIMGCDMRLATDVSSGVALARSMVPELIFCDISLPGELDGYDFARMIRADLELLHIPLVAVSSYHSADDEERALAAGFDRVCGKPVKFADINEVLSLFNHARSHSN